MNEIIPYCFTQGKNTQLFSNKLTLFFVVFFTSVLIDILTFGFFMKIFPKFLYGKDITCVFY
jgi:hypothetical protein